MDKITIVIVDDHPLFRKGVADAFSLEPDFVVVAQASDGIGALRAIRTLQPDIAIIDVNLPGMNGQQLTRRIVADKLLTRVILLTAYDDAEQKMYAMRVGASAYCTKDVQPEELISMARNILNVGLFIDNQDDYQSNVEDFVSTLSRNRITKDTVLNEQYQPLSSREMEVLTFVTSGKSNKEIASRLGISHQTVKNHVTAILHKLGVEDRTQAALFALRRGWVRLYQQGAN